MYTEKTYGTGNMILENGHFTQPLQSLNELDVGYIEEHNNGIVMGLANQ
jgi:hypothetical protein